MEDIQTQEKKNLESYPNKQSKTEAETKKKLPFFFLRCQVDFKNVFIPSSTEDRYPVAGVAGLIGIFSWKIIFFLLSKLSPSIHLLSEKFIEKASVYRKNQYVFLPIRNSCVDE